MVANLFQRPPSTVALVEPGAPGWANRLVLKLLGFFQPVNPRAPNFIWYVNKADLPPANLWPGALCVVVDEVCLGVSDGLAWRRINMGAPIV